MERFNNRCCPKRVTHSIFLQHHTSLSLPVVDAHRRYFNGFYILIVSVCVHLMVTSMGGQWLDSIGFITTGACVFTVLVFDEWRSNQECQGLKIHKPSEPPEMSSKFLNDLNWYAQNTPCFISEKRIRY